LDGAKAPQRLPIPFGPIPHELAAASR